MYSKKQRIAALIGVILLVLLAVLTLVFAIVDKSGMLFRTCLIATIACPILIWVYIWCYGRLTGKHTMADLDLMEGAIEEAKHETSDKS